MFIINKKVCKTPGTRHKQMLKVINNQSMLKNKIIYNINSLTRKKKQFFKRYSLNINKNNLKFSIILINNITYIFKPYKKFFKAYTNTNLHINLPGIEFLNVGKLIYYFIHYKKFKNKFCFKGMLIHLSKIPYTVVFSNLFNKLNAKITYSKSGGTFCKLKKTKKTKKKLLCVVLPSKQEVMLPKFTKAYIGKNLNFKIHKLVEGKRGNSIYCKKKINVRGVAMNPVDHPNGGRSKTPKPERSPWNWIAKHKK